MSGTLGEPSRFARSPKNARKNVSRLFLHFDSQNLRCPVLNTGVERAHGRPRLLAEFLSETGLQLLSV